MSHPRLTSFRVLSFDCYGTIIDQETGFMSALLPTLLQNNNQCYGIARAFTHYQDLVSTQQRLHPTMKFSSILTKIYPELLARIGCTEGATPEAAEAFSRRIGSWPAFPDSVDALTRLKKAGFKLVILSNIDNASFNLTHRGPLENFPFDAIFTAEDIGAYKPDPRTFEFMLERVKERFGVEKGQVLQVAQSQSHDCVPVRELGGMCVWIRRPEKVSGMAAAGDGVGDWRFDTLGDLAGAVEEEGEDLGGDNGEV